MFPISKNSSDFTPFVLYPASGTTVWLVTYKSGNSVGSVKVPPMSQIVNFTISPGGNPVATAVITLRNAIPSDIVYDHNLTRVWFLENDSLAYYNSSSPGNITVERTFPGGDPQFMTIDKNEKIWITLLGTNKIAEYDPVGKRLVNYYTVPAASASLQGITTAPDGTVWFAETTAKKLGHIIPCQTSSCKVVDYGPPSSVEITFPIQLAVDRNGLVWFTDHGGGQFGSFNPSTGEWRVFGIGYCQESYDPDCLVGLPNAISLDSNGMIWFAEHFAGRVAKYDPDTQSLTEYVVAATTIPYVWWMRPGPENLVWFTALGLGAIGYVNASLPVRISISGGSGTVNIEQGTSQIITASIINRGQGAISLNVSASSNDNPFGSAAFLHGFAAQPLISSAVTPVNVTFRIFATLDANVGQRYLTLTAYNNQLAVSSFVRVNVTPTTIPSIFRTSAPYVSVGFAFTIGLGSAGLLLYSLPKSLGRDRNKEEEERVTIPVQSL